MQLFVVVVCSSHLLCSHFFLSLSPSLGVTQIQGNFLLPPPDGTCLNFKLDKTRAFFCPRRLAWN